MSISSKLNERCQGLCELCTTEVAVHDYAVSPKNNDVIENEVAINAVEAVAKTVKTKKTSAKK